MISDLLKNKIDIKMHVNKSTFKKIVKMCKENGINWNGENWGFNPPQGTKTMMLVTNHRRGYSMTYCTDLDFFNKHNAQLVVIK